MFAEAASEALPGQNISPTAGLGGPRPGPYQDPMSANTLIFCVSE